MLLKPQSSPWVWHLVLTYLFASSDTKSFQLVSFGRWDCFVNDSYGGRTFGSPYTKGSVVGVGYVFETGAVFFTLNGMLIGEAMTIEERVKHPYHAAVAADGPAMLSLNFGQSPFLYAIAKSSGSLDGMNFLVPSLGLY
ncbi:hypothetical protein BJ742DRAFT_784875 [Cladochytrium replicatum]|nr:hypothetical protein BJ742DRAFT_784875 [Cladochytrium replicatum]